MDLATGAMGSLLPKLVELVKDEYKLQTGVKKDVESLSRELRSMHAALRKVGEVPRDQLDEQAVLWADDLRELSYDMEDIVDKFLVRVEGADSDGFKKLIEKMCNLFKKGKTRHQIADAIKDMKDQIQDVAARRDRYKIDDVAAKHAAATVVDPRLKAMYKHVSELVGIDGKRDHELIKLLSLSEGEDDDVSKKKLKIASIVGFGGLGKTTLARAVYDKIKGGFDCSAFVPVGRKPDAKKVLRDILLDLDKQKYANSNLTIFDEKQLIDELREFLGNKRYLIVIDDIWDEELWGHINCAFSNVNTRGSRLITTTRNVCVSQACCSSNDDIYKMEPLSDGDSQRLFYGRVFQCETECPPELEQVSRDILKKCGGVPLAIITIASLLASNRKIKSKDQWLGLLNSIGRGLTKGASASAKEMEKILSFSYYDLPSHLKTCLLYLSIFPEDFLIVRERVIWRWIAEGFVQCDQKQETSLFEIGESYFNELINRSMIQPVYDDIGRVYACRVHDMVLDLICSLSSEENFVTILDGTEQSPPNSQSKVRRLSLQGCKSDRTTTLGSLSTSQVRSVTIFEAATNLMPPLSSFDVLRVLDLKGFELRGNSHINLRDVGNLSHLRYLDLTQTGICELPAEIGKLQFLQVLDVRFNSDLKEIPSTVAKLRRLMCLHFDYGCNWLPDGLGNLTSLEVLGWTRASLDIVTELRNLTRMRELCIRFDRESLETEEAFVGSLCNLQNLQSLDIRGSFESVDLLGERWVPPPHLRIFDMDDLLNHFSALPAWIKRDPSHLSDLTKLVIKLKEVQQEDLRILGRLPALRLINLEIYQQTQRLLLIDGFPYTVLFKIITLGASGVIMFQPGALPSAEYVDFEFSVRAAKDEGKGDFDLGLGNLLSLRNCIVHINTEGATVGEAKEAEAALRHAADVHPNHPYLSIDFWPSIKESAADDDICEY